ncbi:MAG: arginase family protein, partial [Planctomycetota bacterium]
MIVRIIGVPIDLGQTRRGVDMGPSAIRYAQLHERIRAIGHEVEDAGNIFVPMMESTRLQDKQLRFLPEVMAVAKKTADVVERALREGRFPLVLGGDHSLAVGSIAGVVRVKPKTAIVWFDAHGDFNTKETTPSGNIHGMAFASAMGAGGKDLCVGEEPVPVSPNHAVLIGVREVGGEEPPRAAQPV